MKTLRYIVPNSFTALSLVFGLVSIVASSSGNYQLASWLILWGVLLDKLDGASARLLNASSEFGVQFDSFADFVVFGIAPASLIYNRFWLIALDFRATFQLCVFCFCVFLFTPAAVSAARFLV